jgi:uncharacterized tellurite resistance protein B-like protein
MSILDLLGLKRDAGAGAAAAAVGDTDTVRKIVARLEAMPPEQARFVAAFAYTLSRVAHADLEISAAETAKMEEVVRVVGGLPEEQAVLVVQIAKSQARLFGGTENYLVTREFREVSTREQREKLLDCLFAVSAADGSITGPEETSIRLIAGELGFTHRELVDSRARWSEYRAVLQGLRQPAGTDPAKTGPAGSEPAEADPAKAGPD